ncbi:hypothetical protein HNP84_006892 [Thermocatellispora tengchongensis]|uniref:Uncharacterized protein n=1 Tax=Thermocatellispora tengchongensis TaxID=1073253 RepID=A0A840PHX3_9ACTN|nr:hypothetical protein [Thermocatellispora tengchongensis]
MATTGTAKGTAAETTPGTGTSGSRGTTNPGNRASGAPPPAPGARRRPGSRPRAPLRCSRPGPASLPWSQGGGPAPIQEGPSSSRERFSQLIGPL